MYCIVLYVYFTLKFEDLTVYCDREGEKHNIKEE